MYIFARRRITKGGENSVQLMLESIIILHMSLNFPGSLCAVNTFNMDYECDHFKKYKLFPRYT